VNTGSIAISALICAGKIQSGALPSRTGPDWAAIGSRYKYLVHQCNGLDECLDSLVYPEVWSTYEKETHSLHGELGRIGLSALQTVLGTQMMQGELFLLVDGTAHPHFESYFPQEEVLAV
jgi:hypothetical protein